MILVTGGTGKLGTLLVARLCSAGMPVTIMSREPDKHADRFADDVRFVRGDLADKASLEDAVAQAEVVVAAAHSIMGRGRNASRYIDDVGGRDLIDVSIASNVRRFVYVSAWFSESSKSNPFFAAKQRVEAYLQASGLTHTIIRPTAFMDMHADELIGARIESNQSVAIFGPGTTPRNFVAADDVAQLIVDTLSDADTTSQSLVIGGPENLSTKDVIATYEKHLDRTAKTMHIPLAVPTVFSKLLKPFHPGLSQILDLARTGERDGDGFDLEEHPACRENLSLDAWVQQRLQRTAH